MNADRPDAGQLVPEPLQAGGWHFSDITSEKLTWSGGKRQRDWNEIPLPCGLTHHFQHPLMTAMHTVKIANRYRRGA